MHFDLETYNIQNYSEPMEQFFFAKILYLLNFGLLQNPLAWCFFIALTKLLKTSLLVMMEKRYIAQVPYS